MKSLLKYKMQLIEDLEQKIETLSGDLAKEKLKSNKKVEWEEPSLNIIEIQIDRSTEHSNVTAKTKINLLKAIDPLTNKIKEN